MAGTHQGWHASVFAKLFPRSKRLQRKTLFSRRRVRYVRLRMEHIDTSGGAADVRGECSFTDDLGADSLDLVELVLALEDEFDFDIVDEDAEELTTVRKLIEYVDAHVVPE